MAARVWFLGSEVPFSRIVLQALLEGGCNVVQIWLTGTTAAATRSEAPPLSVGLPRIPVENLNTLGDIARAWGISLYGIANARELRALQAVQTEPVDLILAACFAFRLPSWLLALPRYGCFNLHPSLLPAYRGPTPLFWQLRAGLSTGGISLHVMTEALDGGDLVAQQRLPLPAGITASQANQQLARRGGRLAVGAITALETATLVRRAQPTQGASYFSWPKERDFRLSADWSAERAFRFIRGTAEWGRPYRLRCRDRCFSIAGVSGFTAHGMLGKPWEWRGDELWIQFRPGILRALLAGEIR